MEIDQVNIGPCFGKHTNWNNSSSIPGNICIQFEAMALTDFYIGVSSEPNMTSSMIEINGGAHGNTELIVRQINKGRKDICKVFTGRLCSYSNFIEYWILIQDQTIAFGMGDTIGEHRLLQCTFEVETPLQYVSFSSWDNPIKYRNIRVQSGESYSIEAFPLQIEPIVLGDPVLLTNLLPEEDQNRYLAECDKLRKRVERFGGIYQSPDIKQYFDTQKVREMQRTGRLDPRTTGFTTGFDMNTEEEKEKRRLRNKRFQTPDFGVEFSNDTVNAAAAGLTDSEFNELQVEKQKRLDREAKFGKISAPMNFEMSEKVYNERIDLDDSLEKRSNSIHLFSLDDNFVQVKTSDIYDYFDAYGPSYVEWMNDSSCTIVFQDNFTASRALIALSAEIDKELCFPVPIVADGDEPTKNVNIHESGWRSGKLISGKRTGEKRWRILLRLATIKDFPVERKLKQRKTSNYRKHRKGQRRHHPYRH